MKREADHFSPPTLATPGSSIANFQHILTIYLVCSNLPCLMQIDSKRRDYVSSEASSPLCKSPELWIFDSSRSCWQNLRHCLVQSITVSQRSPMATWGDNPKYPCLYWEGVQSGVRVTIGLVKGGDQSWGTLSPLGSPTPKWRPWTGHSHGHFVA